MARETHAQRKEREAIRDEIRRMAGAVARNVAGGSMVGLDETGGYTDETWPPFKFSPAPEPFVCACGLPMAPVPQPSRRFDVLPIYLCAVCGLDSLIEACEKVAIEAIARVQKAAV